MINISALISDTPPNGCQAYARRVGDY